MSTIRSCASISDSGGRLLFYTNGDSLFQPNIKSVKLKNRLGIGPGAFLQASLIIPDSKNNSKVFVEITKLFSNDVFVIIS